VFSEGVLSPDFEHGKELVEMAFGEFGIDGEPELSAFLCGGNDPTLRSGCGLLILVYLTAYVYERGRPYANRL
jgi:hypothetical protein